MDPVVFGGMMILFLVIYPAAMIGLIILICWAIYKIRRIRSKK